MRSQHVSAQRPQPLGPVPDDDPVHGRHARRRRAVTRRKWKDMQVRQPAVPDMLQRGFEHLVAFSRKAGNKVGAKHHPGPARLQRRTEGNGLRR